MFYLVIKCFRIFCLPISQKKKNSTKFADIYPSPFKINGRSLTNKFQNDNTIKLERMQPWYYYFHSFKCYPYKNVDLVSISRLTFVNLFIICQNTILKHIVRMMIYKDQIRMKTVGVSFNLNLKVYNTRRTNERRRSRIG